MAYRVLSKAAIAVGRKELAKADRDMARLIKAFPTLPPRQRPKGFDGLVQIIVGQQVSAAAGTSMIKKLREGVGEFTPAHFLGFQIDELRQFSLSRQKASYCLNLALHVVDGSLEVDRLDKLSDEEVCRQLIQVKGIGSWTAEIYCLFCLRRPDLMPSGDLALQVGTQHLKNLAARPTAAQLADIAQAWKPWRSLAAQLLWAYYGTLSKK